MSEEDIARMQERQVIAQDLNHLVKWMQDEFAKIHQRLHNIENGINPSEEARLANFQNMGLNSPDRSAGD